MKFLKLIIFLFCYIASYSQEVNISLTSKKQLLTAVMEAFKDQHKFSFSYDVEAIKDISLTIKKEVISIPVLQLIIEKQTPFLLQKISATDYIIVKNTKVVDICGVLIDAESKFELTQADILQNNRPIDITDNKGAFQLQLHPWDSITIAYLGYKNKTFKVSEFSSISCDTIRLQPEIHNLGQVLVKEYLTGGIHKNQDASVSISTKKLRILPGLAEPDVLQSLQLLPGISSPTEDPAGLYIRGGTPGQNLILWDGIKMYQSGHFFNQISTFNPFITKNVTVYRGGTSVRYGDRISGVVVIESDDDLTEKIKAGGGLNFTHADAYLKIPLSKKLGLMLAGRRSTTDVYQSLTYNNLVRKVFQNTRATIPDIGEEDIVNEESRDDDFSFSDVNFKMVWNPDSSNAIKFSSIFAENRLDNKRNEVPLGDRSDNFEDNLKNRNIGFSFNWDKEYSTSIKQNVNFYYSFYDQRYKLVRELVDLDITEVIRIDNGVKDIGGEYSLKFPITKKQSLFVGYQFSYNETVYGIKLDFDPEAIEGNGTNHTVYSEYTYKTPKNFINLGVRASQLSNVNKLYVEPRIFLSREVFKNFTLNSSAELKNQQLNNYLSDYNVEEEFPILPVSDNVWILSSNTFSREGESLPDIRVVKSMQFTLGGLYTYKGWNFDIEGYYKRIKDFSSESDFVIYLATQDDFETDDYYGKQRIIGLDFLIKKRIQNYRFWAGYSFSKNTTSYPLVQKAYFTSNYDQPHVFNFSQTLKHNNFEFALGWNYATGRPFTKIIEDADANAGGTIDPRGINSSRFKNYHRLDASVVYHFNPKTQKTWNGFIGFSLRNIYNRRNVIRQGYREVTDSDFDTTLQSFQNQSLRITPDLVIRFKF